MRDTRIAQPRQDVALAPESLFTGAPDQRDVQQLDRRASLEPAIAALREPHAAGAALSERRDETVRAEHLSGKRRRRRRLRIQHGALEEPRLANVPLLRQNRAQIGGE